MAWTRTLGNLVTDILDRTDLSAFSSRHPSATVRRRLMESYQSLREWMTNEGSNYFVGGPYSLMPTGTNVGYGSVFKAYSQTQTGTLKYSLDHIRRVEAYYLNRWREVARVTPTDADKWSNYQFDKFPREWFVLGAGMLYVDETGGTLGPVIAQEGADTDAPASGRLRILVMPYDGSGACPLRAYGMPSLDTTNFPDADGTVLQLDGPGFDWLIYDVAKKLIVRENDGQGTYQMILNELAMAEKKIRDSIHREVSMPVRRRDVFDNNDRYRYRRGT